MIIRVFFNDKPAPISDCHSVSEVATWGEANIMLWASAKLDPPEYAIAWAPMAIEGRDNTPLKDLPVPEQYREAVEKRRREEQAHIDHWKSVKKIEDMVCKAFNGIYEDLGNAIGDDPNFAEIVKTAAEQWAHECVNEAGTETLQYFDRYIAGDR